MRVIVCIFVLLCFMRCCSLAGDVPVFTVAGAERDVGDLYFRLLEGSAARWKDHLSLHADFTGLYEIRSLRGGDVLQSYRVRGEFATDGDGLKLSWFWQDSLVGSGVPFSGLDFVSSGTSDVWHSVGGGIRQHVPTSDGIEWQSYTQSPDVRFQLHNGAPMDRRYPILRCLNSIFFTGGWSKGVVAGGLDLGDKTEEALLTIMQGGHLTDVVVDVRWEIQQDEVQCLQLITLPNQSTINRALRFSLVEGLWLKIQEDYTSKGSNQSIRLQKTCSATEFVRWGGVPIPLTLTVVASDHLHGVEITRHIRLLESTLRTPKTQDFDISGPLVHGKPATIIGSGPIYRADSIDRKLVVEEVPLLANADQRQTVLPVGRSLSDRLTSSFTIESQRNNGVVALVTILTGICGLTFSLVLWRKS